MTAPRDALAEMLINGYDHHTHGGTDAPECTTCTPARRGGA